MEITLTEKDLERNLELLDSIYYNAIISCYPVTGEAAEYTGAVAMMQEIISKSYTNCYRLERDETGKHRIKGKENQKETTEDFIKAAYQKAQVDLEAERERLEAQRKAETENKK